MVLYFDWLDALDVLEDDSTAYKVIHSIADYAQTGKEANFDGDKSANMAYTLMLRQYKRDAAKYENICNKRAECGRKGGLSKSKQVQANAKNLSKSKQTKANQADNEYEYDNDNVYEYEYDNDCDTDTDHELYTSHAEVTQPPENLISKYGADYCTHITDEQKDNIDYFKEMYQIHTGHKYPQISLNELVSVSRAFSNGEIDKEDINQYFGDITHKGLCGNSDCNIHHFLCKAVQEILCERKK